MEKDSNSFQIENNVSERDKYALGYEDVYRILIVEDDADINQLLCKIFKRAGYEVMQAFSGTEARLLLGMSVPDMIILDLMLPGLTGEELIELIREEMGLDMPILVLSAKAGLESRIAALKRGADDYLIKPFEPEEVLAHVYAALRRYRGQSGPGTGSRPEGPESGKACLKALSYKKLCLYPEARRAVIKDEELPLTAHEFDILELLLSKPEKVYSREYLYEQVWKGGYYGEDNTVNVHVSNLRKKLGAADPGEEYIKTVWGIGFKMA